jgi:hypothetical protein
MVIGVIDRIGGPVLIAGRRVPLMLGGEWVVRFSLSCGTNGWPYHKPCAGRRYVL